MNMWEMRKYDFLSKGNIALENIYAKYFNFLGANYSRLNISVNEPSKYLSSYFIPPFTFLYIYDIFDIFISILVFLNYTQFSGS